MQLSPTEFKLLRYLMLNANRVLSKAQILDHVWNYDFRGDDNIVESYISYLRRKVDNVPAPADPHPARRRLRAAQAGRLTRRSLPMSAAACAASRCAVKLVAVGAGAGRRRARRDQRGQRATPCAVYLIDRVDAQLRRPARERRASELSRHATGPSALPTRLLRPVDQRRRDQRPSRRLRPDTSAPSDLPPLVTGLDDVSSAAGRAVHRRGRTTASAGGGCWSPCCWTGVGAARGPAT